ncbi:hypothetical protein Syun_023639 [Stephania yunnanensis]|uniref:Uncharacterized protein n=1 Tax=Stephania yunnanensis TaxID=152371 RepID=A0AAP0FHH7_9MAGN
MGARHVDEEPRKKNSREYGKNLGVYAGTDLEANRLIAEARRNVLQVTVTWRSLDWWKSSDDAVVGRTSTWQRMIGSEWLFTLTWHHLIGYMY